MNKSAEPAINLNAFTCPHCEAYAAQDWYITAADKLPGVPTVQTAAIIALIRNAKIKGSGTITSEEHSAVQRAVTLKKPLLSWSGNNAYDCLLHNVFVSSCHRCRQLGIWLYEQLIYPAKQATVAPNADLDPDIQADFNEARQIVHQSPRGAAALLRLALQKLCVQLGEPGKNIDSDIASLFAKGLDPHMQMALDSVRVIGNEAVHPGSLDLRDDKDTALFIFELLNAIADQMITRPKAIKNMYDRIPQAKRDGIDARNAAAVKAAPSDKNS